MKKTLALSTLLVAAVSAGTHTVLAASIGVNFVDTPEGGIQDGLSDSLTTGETAGISGYTQTNWNNFGRWSNEVTAVDNQGASTPVSIAWDSTNTYRNNGNALLTGDDKLMHGYLDSNGEPNEAAFTSIFGSNSNKALVYLTGVSSWLSAENATAFDLIIYLDGDTTGRVGEYWLQSASGSHTNFTLGIDITPHLFGRDFGDFISYDPVDPSATSLGAADDGNYILFANVPATDTFLIRTEEGVTRVPINGFQIVAVPEPSIAGFLGLGTLGLTLIRRRKNA